MRMILNYAGLASGLFGILLCAVAGLGRLLGHYYIAGFQAPTLFVAGMGLVAVACLLRLELLVLLRQPVERR